jgi:hypothetical protein
VVAEAIDQAPRAPAEVVGESSNANAAAAAHELSPRPFELGRSRRRVGQPLGEEGFEEIEALVPGERLPHPRRQLFGAGQELVERLRPVGELVQRQSEHPARAERRQAQLQAREGAFARDLGRSGVEAGEEAVDCRALDAPGRAEVEDQRDSRERQLVKARATRPFSRPPFERLPEQRPQRRRRQPSRHLPADAVLLVAFELHALSVRQQ